MNKRDVDMTRRATLSPVELRATWFDTYDEESPALSPALLRLGIAYRWQEKDRVNCPRASPNG